VTSSSRGRPLDRAQIDDGELQLHGGIAKPDEIDVLLMNRPLNGRVPAVQLFPELRCARIGQTNMSAAPRSPNDPSPMGG
jgi:hypothetical protein